MTPEEIDALPDVTDAQELKYWKHVRREIGLKGQAIGATGRSLTRADLGAINKMIEELEEKVEVVEQGESGGLALVRYGERQ